MPAGTDAASAGVAFAEAARAARHDVVQLFFFHDGVRCAALPGEHPLRRALSRLAESGTELVVCVSAAERRGVTVDPPFTVTGVGQLIEGAVNADKHLTFLA